MLKISAMCIPARRSLRSTELGFLIVPFAHATTKQNRTLSVVCPSLWNGLSLALRLFPRILFNSFYAHQKLSFLAVLESGALLSRDVNTGFWANRFLVVENRF